MQYAAGCAATAAALVVTEPFYDSTEDADECECLQPDDASALTPPLPTNGPGRERPPPAVWVASARSCAAHIIHAEGVAALWKSLRIVGLPTLRGLMLAMFDSAKDSCRDEGRRCDACGQWV